MDFFVGYDNCAYHMQPLPRRLLPALARDELAAHKLHVAETYINKAGMRETAEQIMEAIHGV
ncbi:hypothetical protein JNB91_15845 [Rhizobium wenxiniae]|uniref:hypothetical protein n=1 Tax=Rhizobium wenxiniae TaxID=1737357 RepID=UPI001C6F16CF|nr:hypothetical protein [Rhizobium wenxiniae]MBW9089308.1 hypothetical protein [Rhizobium wenxiniae]